MTCLASCNFGLKRVLFLLLCSSLLLLVATSARAQSDPCSPALPVLNATGCGQLITVLAVDGNGVATSFSVANLGNGNPYDQGKDDWLVGIVNNSGANLLSITLTTASGSPEPAFAFDHDGPCKYNSNDCTYCRATGYEGPNNTFVVPSDQNTTGTVNFNTAIPTGGNTWFALEGIVGGNVTQKVTPVSTNAPTITDFSNTGGENQQTIDYSSVTNLNTPILNPQLLTLNNPISNSSTWPQYVAGTPWAVSQCASRPSNGTGDFCSLYINACFNATIGIANAADTYCPSVANPTDPTSGSITLKDKWDPPPVKPGVPNGTTVSLIDFVPLTTTESWVASASVPNPVCTNVFTTGSSNVASQCDISDSLVSIYGDQTTTKGSKPKKGWLISVFNVPMLLTLVKLVPPVESNVVCSSPLNDTDPGSPTFESPTFAQNKWNNGACLLDLLVNPATLPLNTVSANNFLAAPPAKLTFGIGGVIANTDHQLTNSNTTTTPAQPWDTNTGISLSSLFGGDGTFTMHWSAADTVGIGERHIRLIQTTDVNPPLCDDPDKEGIFAPCYNTNLFTAQVNIDSVAPVATCPSADATWHKTDVSVNCTATDATSGIGVTGTTPTVTGVPSAGGTVVNFTVSTNVSGTPPYWSANASTSSQTLCDLASNCSTTSVSGFKIDEVPPTVGLVTFSPASAGNVYTQGASVTALFASCGDVGSGLASCVGNGSIVSGGSIVTSTIGNNLPFTVVATDLAGNTTSSTVYYSVIAPTPPADVALFEQETSDTPKHGATLNYIVWAIDLTKGASASNVIVNFSIPAGVAGSVTGKVADVSCNLLTGCSAMPPSGGSTCSVSPDNTQVSCNIGTLASIYTLKGAVAKISIPIAAPTGSKFNISATVTSANDPNAKNNTLVDSITVK